MLRISLCIIIRDEVEMLAGHLESAAPAVAKIVVLDTGSTDNTCEIIGDFGATVIPAAWTDFRTARNQVLRWATGNWALVLDADEEAILKTPDQLRELADSYERLRLPGGSRTTSAANVDIIHHGFIPEIFKKKRRAARNRAILEHWVVDEGETCGRTSILPAKTSVTPSSERRRRDTRKACPSLLTIAKRAPGSTPIGIRPSSGNVRPLLSRRRARRTGPYRPRTLPGTRLGTDEASALLSRLNGGEDVFEDNLAYVHKT